MRKPWYRYYLLGIGSLLVTLGLILIYRDFTQHRSIPGMILGIALIIYGILRLKQRNSVLIKS